MDPTSAEVEGARPPTFLRVERIGGGGRDKAGVEKRRA